MSQTVPIGFIDLGSSDVLCQITATTRKSMQLPTNLQVNPQMLCHLCHLVRGDEDFKARECALREADET